LQLAAKKDADVAEYAYVLAHVGLLFNEPPGTAGLPFIKSSEHVFGVAAKRTPTPSLTHYTTSARRRLADS
jgi:hypothetical protein